MNKKLLLLAGLCSITMQSFAIVYTIQTGTGSGMSFSPASIANVHPGDTVKWKWTAGTHNTTSQVIPGGATAWAHNISAATDSFTYIPTVTGTYNYICTIHGSMMSGSFTVVPVTGIAPVSGSVFSMSPNPAGGRVQLKFNNANAPVSVVITDMAGRTVKKADYGNVTEANVGLDGIANGTYFIRAAQGSVVHTEQLVIAH